jgi:uroporphyrinogen-III synthase
MAHASFAGLRVLSLESRRAKEIEKLIRTYGGEPFVVPAMREVPLDSNAPTLEFARQLIAGKIDVVVLLTGVGVRALIDIVTAAGDRDAFLKALGSTRIISRGPKPEAALREFGIRPLAIAPEPNTWNEVIALMDKTFGEEFGELNIAVQEYGASNPELLAALSQRAASVFKVPVYKWELPANLQPLRETVHGIAHAQIDIILFTTAVQVIHLMMVAQEMNSVPDLMRGLRHIAVISIGPTTSAELQHYGITPDFEPSRPKLGFLVNEAAQYAGQVLGQKRELASAIGYDLLPSELPAEPAKTEAVPKRPVRKVAESTSTMAGFTDGLSSFEFVHEISRRIASADPLHTVLDHIVGFVTSMVPCDSCFIYVVQTDSEPEKASKKQADKLILRASSNPHADIVDQLDLSVGQGITGWVAEHREPVAISSKASEDPRFKPFKNLPEDTFEAILSTPILCANKVVGVINLQHRLSYQHTDAQRQLLSTIGFLVGAEIERARLESENVQLVDRLETRKTVERAKGILQRDLGLSESESYMLMQRESRQRRRSMREIAEALLLGDELKKLKA